MFWFDWQAFAIRSCIVFQGLVAALLAVSTALVRLEAAATLIWYQKYVESFEVAEYGMQPSDEDLRAFFPMHQRWQPMTSWAKHEVVGAIHVVVEAKLQLSKDGLY